MAASLGMTMFFLVFCISTQLTSAAVKRRDLSRWPKPPCKMYYPMNPDYESSCPDIAAYVCATNGHTYKNECFFCIEQWKLGSRIKFEKYGRCD